MHGQCGHGTVLLSTGEEEATRFGGFLCVRFGFFPPCFWCNPDMNKVNALECELKIKKERG